jgi:hypothetical protein
MPTHISELRIEVIVAVVKLNVVHTVNASEKGEWELSTWLVHYDYILVRMLTKMMVMTVNNMIDRPCRSVSSACLTAS